MNPVYNMIPIAPSTVIQPQPQHMEPIHRAKRTRAKRSCDNCRKRKTRCDADVKQPCTKCSLSDRPCEFLVEQKKRGPSSGSYIEELEDRLIRMENLLKNISKEKRNDMEHNNLESLIVHDRQSSDSSMCSQTPTRTSYCEEEQETEKIPTYNCSDFVVTPAEKEIEAMQVQMDSLTLSDYQRTRYFGASAGVQFLKDEFLQVNIQHPLPEDPSWFVQKLNDDDDEHVIMKSKKFSHPPVVSNELRADRIAVFEDTPYLTQELADYLVHMYFTRVHMYCPIINKIQFLEQYYFHNPTPPDKYILFAMTSIVLSVFLPNVVKIDSFKYTVEQLTECQEVLKEKALKLLAIVYKRSMISTVQALILLSMFTNTEVDEEDTSHWFMTGMAIRMAQDLGLHRDCTKWKIPDYEVELRKRIWYAAYLMDRWVASELGRPISIFDHEFDVELPTPYEIHTPFTSVRENTPLLILEAESSLQQKKPVYSCFLYMVTLAQILGQVLVGFHSTRGKQNPYANLELLHVLDRNLTNWKLSLPVELNLDTVEADREEFYAPACTVNMVFECTWILLYRPFIKLSRNQPENTELAVKALSICTASAKNLVTIVESVQHYSFLALPWNMAVHAVFQGAIIFLHNAKGKNMVIREQGICYLLRCSRIYNHDPYLRKSRVIKLLQQIVCNFTDLATDPSCLTNHIRYTNQQNEQHCPLLKPVNRKPALVCYNDRPSESSSAYCSGTEDFKTATDVFPLASSRPEDMFLSSLNFGLQNQQQQQLQQQQLQQQLEQQNIAEINFNPYARVGLIDEYEPLQQEFDVASLSSKLPIWEVPSGVTWNEWETFLKASISNDNEIYQGNNL
ncbi:hypothetical protein INT48_005483 [Thamnidium elegans]|uniref:Zn(2)-C6 fungal-type domain-containing protein n=1 Tax=Thamnidium elegans TaxID=101142 RepID=A0A8H7SEZ5_9FUNG|nr:hypothetical protein INT48_005483 [Thamnidium elegans]